MANGIMIESRIQATNIDALNRSVVGTIDVAGGGLVSLTAPNKQGEDRWTLAAPAAGSLGELWMMYNPTEHLTVVGTGANAKYFSGLSEDPRDYTNLATRSAVAFKPKVGDEVVITIDAIDASGAQSVAGDFLESKAGQTTFARIAAATGATAGSTAFQIEWVGNLPFPQGGIGMEFVKAFKAVCVQE